MTEEDNSGYVVHIRVEPADGTMAKSIIPFKCESPLETLFEDAAALEALLNYRDPSCSYRVVEITDSEGILGNSRGETQLPTEDREKINRFLPGMYQKGVDELKKLTDLLFTSYHFTRFIG